MNTLAIEAHELTKIFPEGIIAVNELNLQVKPGAVYGLIGRNGSGKTSTLRLLMGLLRPDRGVARLLGRDFWHAPRAVRSRVAFVSQNQLLPGGWSLEEMTRALCGLYERWDQNLAQSLAKRWNLPWTRSLGTLSSGEQRKASLLLAFATRPEVLLLDEPASGFDLVARRELIEQIVDAITQSDGCTVLLSTHLISDLERVADHVGVVDRGRMAMSVRLEDLLNETRRVQIIFEDEQCPEQFEIPGALRTWHSGSVLRALVRWPRGDELELLKSSLAARVQVFPAGLEEIFIELFGDGIREEGDQEINRNGNGALRRS